MTLSLKKLLAFAIVLAGMGSAQSKEKLPLPANSSGAMRCMTNSAKFDQGYGLCNEKLPIGYNAQGGIDVNCSCDVFISGSFLYWRVDQEGMDLAYNTPFTSFVPTNASFLIQDFTYNPGFKAGLGAYFGRDQWLVYAEYTWLHQMTNATTFPPGGEEWALSDWLVDPSSQYPQLPVEAVFIDSAWKIHFDMIDLSLSRPFYQGKNIIVSPSMGIRGARIRQTLDLTAHQPGPFMAKNTAESWAIGPKTGLQNSWHLGCGWRLEGDFSASLLYTKCTKASHEQSDFAGFDIPSYHCRDYSAVRPMADLGLGLGWGSYFHRRSYHCDLLALYEFKMLWGQNMMRAISSAYASGIGLNPTNLQIHGLTLTGRVDF